MLYEQWIPVWLENYIQPASKKRTYIRYWEIARQHIIPRLGELELSEITPSVLQPYVTELLKNGNRRTGGGLAANSVNSIISVIQGTLKTAYLIGILDEYVGDKIKRPRTVQRRIECFSLDEQKKLERNVLNSDSARMFGVVLTLYTGLRIGELLALEWSDIDTQKSEICVNKTCYYGKDSEGDFCRITDSPKTESSMRTIPLPKQLIKPLRELKKKAARYTSYRTAKILCR